MDTGQLRFDHGHPQPDSDVLRELIESTNRDAIVTEAPKQPFRLGYFSTACLIINRVIGTGIFSSPGTVIRGTNSTGATLLLWAAGCLYGFAGVHLYTEYGLNVPRYVIDGIEQAVPRSGGDLHYLQYVYRWWYYKKDTVLLVGCLFGISFICLGNMAGNSIAFAVRVLAAANPDGPEPSKEVVRGVALAAAAFACIIHSVSRRGGIWLSNLFACIKIGILLVIVVLAIKYKPSVIAENFTNSFEDVVPEPKFDGCRTRPQGEGDNNGYAKAFLSIIFAFSGFEQANYVLGEVSRPRRTFPRAAFFAMAVISVMYMVVNICYMAVVTAYEQQIGAAGHCPTDNTVEDVALLFFKKALASDDDNTPDRVFNALLALSSFGNIIVMTYTATRMKQEIAKQGFIPFPQFFARNADLSIGRLVVYLRDKAGIPLRFITPENHREPTPVGALVLHLISCTVLIFATFGLQTSQDAYSLLTSLGAYLITAFFGSFLALGILILRVFGPPQPEVLPDDHSPAPARKTWREMTAGSVNPYLSVLCAVVYLCLNLFPVIASWVPAVNSSSGSNFAGWLVPVISWTVLGVSAAWWVGFLALAKYRSKRQQKEFVYEVRPEFDWAEPEPEHWADGPVSEGRRRDEGKILAHETVLLAWVGGEMGMFATGGQGQAYYMDHDLGAAGGIRQRQKREEEEMMVRISENPLAGTDFDVFGGAAGSDGCGLAGR